ncbi:MAG TPA: isocitrate/isopropylmalate family dehydrogenase [Ardenticatenaceae bacterium]|jgi:homoisocitrate dehydrogenase
MVERELVIIPGDDIGREVIPLAAQVLRAALPIVRLWDAEAGYQHAWRTGEAIDAATLDLARRVRYVFIGPERPFPEGTPSAIEHLTRALDLYAALYPVQGTEPASDLLLLAEHRPEPAGEHSYQQDKALSPEETWAATRLGNLAGELASKRRGRVAIVHDSEEPFAHAVVAGIAAPASVERLDALFLVNHWQELAGDLDLLVASATTGRLLLDHITAQPGTMRAASHLLLGPRAAVATPAHGPLREQVGWGFANPLGALHAAVALLRYAWDGEAAAQRLESAIQRATARRRTPDQGGIHTNFEVVRAILDEVQRTLG